MPTYVSENKNDAAQGNNLVDLEDSTELGKS